MFKCVFDEFASFSKYTAVAFVRQGFESSGDCYELLVFDIRDRVLGKYIIG